MGLLDRFKKQKDQDIFEEVKTNLQENGVPEEDTLEHFDKTIERTSSGPYETLDKMIENKFSRASQKELTRILLERTGSKDKAAILTDYYISKEQGANVFDIETREGIVKSDVPISDFVEYVDFILDNNACPDFKRKK